MQPLPVARPPFYTHHSLPPGLHLTRWLPTFDLHQSPDLIELPPSPPPPSYHCHYHCRPAVATSALVYAAHPWALTYSHSALAPLLPAIKHEPSPSLSSSPSSSPTRAACAPRKPKRKRGEQEQQSSERPGSGARGHNNNTNNDVATSTAPQVVKWKLNAPRYKRSKVETAGGGSEWKRCEHCGTDSTPEWRAGPLGKGTLCNACGLRYRTKLREQKKRETLCGSVPMSLLLNPVSSSTSAGGNKKGRANISNPMIWETKVSTSSFHIADLLNQE